MYKRFFFLVFFMYVVNCFGADFNITAFEQESKEVLVVRCQRLALVLQQVDQQMKMVVKPALEQVEAALVESDRKNIALKHQLLKSEEKKNHYKKTAINHLYEIGVLDNQLRELRSFNGWLFHKKSMRVWLGVAFIFAAYKKGLFKRVARYEQKLKNYLCKKVRPRVEKKEAHLRKKLLLFRGFCKKKMQKCNRRLC